MKRSIARRWAKALDSGDYKQTTGELRDEVTNEFCCLGVLCNIHAQDHPEIAATQTKKYEYLGKDDILPSSVVEWAGMHDEQGQFRTGTISNAVSLIECNDNFGMTFKEIAKIIRKHWKEL